MREISYYEFVKISNEVGENDWSIKEIVENNLAYDALVLTDDYFSVEIYSESLDAINALVNLFTNEGFSLVGQTYASKSYEVFRKVGIEFEEDEEEEKIIHEQDGEYYISLIPKNEFIETFNEFLAKYEQEILKVAVDNDLQITLKLAQLDDKISGMYTYSKEHCAGIMIIESSLRSRDLYIACCMLNQAVSSPEEFEYLNGCIYVDDVETVLLTDENADEPFNQEILKMIENGDDRIECLVRYDEDGNVVEGSEEAVERALKGITDICS